MKSGIVDELAIGAEKRGDGAVVYVSVHELPRADEVLYNGDARNEHLSPPFAKGDQF